MIIKILLITSFDTLKTVLLMKWYDMCFIVDVVLFDFAKAFDVVSHYLLLDKLRLLGICSLQSLVHVSGTWNMYRT